MDRRTIIFALIGVIVVLCLLVVVLGGLLYSSWQPQEEPEPIIIVATLTPTSTPEGGAPAPSPTTAPPPPTPAGEQEPTGEAAPTATPPAAETVAPPTSGEVPVEGGDTSADQVICDIDADMKAHLQDIMAAGHARGQQINVFAKVGDSISESMAFVFDLGDGYENLGDNTYLSEIVDYFREVTVDTMDGEAHNSFNRQSLIAISGACAGAALEAETNRALYQEFEAINPGIAIIMFGTNDVILSDLETYRREMNRILDVCEEEGVIPILSTIPDRLDSPEAGALALEYNAAIRQMARSRDIPLLDYWLALQPLPNKGIDEDGIHPNAYFDGEFYGTCDFTDEPMQYGFNVRNKTLLDMLLKIKQVVIDDGPPDTGTGETGEVAPPTVSPEVGDSAGAAAATEAPPTSRPPTAGGVRPFPDTSDGIYVFNDQLAGWSMTEEQYQFAATHYAGTQKMTLTDVRHLRQTNPDFIVLHYRLGLGLGYQAADGACQPSGEWLTFIDGDEWVQEWPGDEVVPASWLFPWAGQSRVFNCDWGWFVMELNDPGWRAWWSQEVLAEMAASESDGLFADSFSVPNHLGADHYNPSLPAVDATFEEAWSRRIEDFIAYVQGQFGDYYLIPNVGQWVVGRDTTDYSGVDGVMIEGFAEWGPQDPFDLADWQLQMNRILGLARQDKIIIAQGYLWEPDDIETRLFYLGNYLLVKGRHSFINTDYSMEPEYFPEYDIQLGAPLDALPAGIDGLLNAGWGVYTRSYENGMVLVNPGPDSRAVDLGGTYYLARPSGGGLVPANGDISAWSVDYVPVDRVDLAPYQAAILLNAAPS